MSGSSQPTAEGCTGDRGGGLPSAEVVRALGHPVRRLVVSLLRERTDPIPVHVLADTVSSRDALDGSVDRIETGLVHRHLPALDAAALAAWDHAAGTVTQGEHPALERPVVRAATTAAAGTPDALWDEAFPALAPPRRRMVVDSLDATDGPVRTSALAAAIADREHPTSGSGDATAQIQVALHHVDLPAMADAGLIEYDSDEGTVVGRDHQLLDWVAVDAGADGGLVTAVETDGC